MKTTLDLLNEAIEMGFEKDYALNTIDANLDDAVGFENRKPLSVEELTDELYNDIIYIFKCEKEAKEKLL